MGLAGIQGCPRVDSGLRRNDMGARRRCAGERAGRCHSRMGLAGIAGLCTQWIPACAGMTSAAQAVSGRRAGVVSPAWG